MQIQSKHGEARIIKPVDFSVVQYPYFLVLNAVGEQAVVEIPEKFGTELSQVR